MKTLLLTLTYLVGAGELILAIYFWVTNSKNEIRRVMALLAFSTGMWVILNGLTSYVIPNAFVTVALNLLFIFGFLIALFLVWFSVIYPHPLVRLDSLHKMLIGFVILSYSYIALFTNTIYISYDVGLENPGFVVPGPTFGYFNYSISFLFTIAIAVMLLRRKESVGLQKRNWTILLSTIVAGGLPAIVLNLWSVFYSIRVNPLLAVIPSIFWVAGTIYIIRVSSNNAK